MAVSSFKYKAADYLIVTSRSGKKRQLLVARVKNRSSAISLFYIWLARFVVRNFVYCIISTRTTYLYIPHPGHLLFPIRYDIASASDCRIDLYQQELSVQRISEAEY